MNARDRRLFSTSMTSHGLQSPSGVFSLSNPSISLLPLGQTMISAGAGASRGKSPDGGSTRRRGADLDSEDDSVYEDSLDSPDDEGRTVFKPVLSDSPHTHENRAAYHHQYDQYRKFDLKKSSHNPSAEESRQGRRQIGELFTGFQLLPGINEFQEGTRKTHTCSGWQRKR